MESGERSEVLVDEKKFRIVNARSVLAFVDPQKIVGRWRAGRTDLVQGPFGLFQTLLSRERAIVVLHV